MYAYKHIYDTYTHGKALIFSSRTFSRVEDSDSVLFRRASLAQDPKKESHSNRAFVGTYIRIYEDPVNLVPLPGQTFLNQGGKHFAVEGIAFVLSNVILLCGAATLEMLLLIGSLTEDVLNFLTSF